MNIPSSLYLPALLGMLVACSAGGETAKSGSNIDSSGNSGTTSATTNPSTAGTSTDVQLKPQEPIGTVDPNDKRPVPIRKKQCDSAGENCTCLRLGLLGTLDSLALNKDTKPFTDWLNGKSGGTATATLIPVKPIITDAYLADFDVLIIANVNGWTFTADEKAAVERWVRTTGGGIISLTGFKSDAAEPAATSQLIAFSGVHYTSVKAAENGQQVPVYYKGGSVNLKDCLAWSGSSEPIITTPIKFTPQTGGMDKLTFSLDYVGAYIGFGIEAPAAATVVAKDPVSNQPVAVAYQLDQGGRIFAFGDEWVVFASQWEPIGTSNNKQQDQYNKCWVMPQGDVPGFFHSVATLYQTKQFWFNAINWVAPPNECNFIIKDEGVVQPIY